MRRSVLPANLASGARALPALLVVCGLVAIGSTLLNTLHELRGLATMVFLLLGPGWALAGFLVTRSLAERFVVAAGAGAAISILIGQAMAVTGAWHPVGVLYLTGAVTVPVLVWHMLSPAAVASVTAG